MGFSWAYTVLGALFLIGSVGPIASMRYGIAWRQAKKEKDERKEEEKRARADARSAR
jgi:hypothetical protein